MVDVADVIIWNEMVGAVRWDYNRGLASFQYNPKFLKNGWELSPLKMPLRSGDRIYTFPELKPSRAGDPDTFYGMPGMLADALPDKYGNQLINTWLASHGRPENDMNPVEKLCFIGTRGIGALEFEPAQLKANKNTFKVEIDSLVVIAQKMLAKREAFETNLNEAEERAMKEILRIGTSAGGVRPKAVITYNEKTDEVRSGQTKAPQGFEHWLIKFDGVSSAQIGVTHGWGRVEMAYYLMAKDCGIEMTACRLLEENDRAHFMTKRFDREGSYDKHHLQTLCALQHYDYQNLYGYGYEQVFQTMRMLRLTYPEAEQMFRRMVFNVMACNYDDHTKNFSFMLKKNSGWQLSPAYDMCYAYDPDNEWVNQHTLSINGKHRNINREDMLNVASTISIKKGDRIVDEIKSVVSKWNNYAEELKVDAKLRESISSTLIKLK